MEKLGLSLGIIFIYISLASTDDLDDRWKMYCDDPWFENCRNLGVLWKCQKFNQCIQNWRENSADYNEYFLDQLNDTIENVFDANGNLKAEYVPFIEYHAVKIDTAIHSAPNPYISVTNLDNDTDIIYS